MVILGFITENYWLLFSSIFGFLLVLGFSLPRNQAYIYTLIPEDSMGSISAAMGLIDIVFPSLLTMTAVAIAGGVGVFIAMIFYLIFLCINSIFLYKTKFKDI